MEGIRQVFRGTERVERLPERRGAASAAGFELAGASAPPGIGVGGPRASKGEKHGGGADGEEGEARRQASETVNEASVSSTPPSVTPTGTVRRGDGDERERRSRQPQIDRVCRLGAHVEARDAA